jgi:hypothetical protein
VFASTETSDASGPFVGLIEGLASTAACAYRCQAGSSVV